jgi:hypothetical protein
VALLQGVYAEVVTPRRGGEIDLGATLEIIDFLNKAKVDGVVLFGAAGEFAHFGLEERRKIFNLAVRRCRVPLLAGVTHSTLDGALDLADAAIRAGAESLLLAPPYFYRYSQADLYSFYVSFIRETNGTPVYIYNLPENGTPVEPATALALLDTGRFAGMANSSDADWASESPTRSGISSAAGAIPEVLLAIRDGKPLGPRLHEFLAHAACLPFPAAIREALTSRKVKAGPHAVEPTKLAEFREWFQPWFKTVEGEVRHGK